MQKESHWHILRLAGGPLPRHLSRGEGSYITIKLTRKSCNMITMILGDIISLSAYLKGKGLSF